MVRLTTVHLQQHGIEQPRLDAELICAQALALRRLDLYLQFDRPLHEEELGAVRALLRRRARGEPMAYISGVREFYGRAFAVTPAVLVPRPDTETVVEQALLWARAQVRPLRVLDLGTGSGCLAVTLAAELGDADVTAVDISAAALRVAGGNARRHGVTVRFLEGSWWEPLGAEAPYDLVVSNPPYITDEEMAALPRDVREHEPELALRAGADGLAPYRELVAGVAGGLAGTGAVLLEVDPRRADAVSGLLRAALPGATAVIHADLAERARVVMATRS